MDWHFMRDTRKLHPKLQKKLIRFLVKCRKRGLDVRITECVRTEKEQNELYAIGRTKPGEIITNCRGSAYASMHQWGVAFDICRNDGRPLFDNSDRFFEKCGRIGQKLGLEWGGRWENFPDLSHFQLPDWGSTAIRLKRKYGTPEQFRKIFWKINLPNYGNRTSKEAAEFLSVRAAIKSLQNSLGFPKTGYPSKELAAACPGLDNETKGKKAEIVKALQELLKQKGYETVVNGYYGNWTQKAVIQFKRDQKISKKARSSAAIQKGGLFWKRLLGK